tara:strand:- start:462 stop:611 length:150 start_codon:yes stop_codon:yes gene_type:complete
MEKKKRGRPMIEIDADKVEMLASFGCSTVRLQSYTIAMNTPYVKDSKMS